VPYDIEANPSINAHCISQHDVLANAQGVPQSRKFIAVYGAMERAKLREMTITYRDADYSDDGRPMDLSGGYDKARRDFSYHPRRGNGKLFREYERILNDCGLSANLSKGSRQYQIISTNDPHPPTTRSKTALTECTHKHGIDSGMTAPSVTIHERHIPEWTASDPKVCAFLKHRYPHAFQESSKVSIAQRKRARQCATELCAIIYLFFRLMLPVATISEDLGLTFEHVVHAARQAIDHYPRFENGTCRCRRTPEALATVA
jgi:hypothetical protein